MHLVGIYILEYYCKYFYIVDSSTKYFVARHHCVSVSPLNIFILLTATSTPSIKGKVLLFFPWQHCLRKRVKMYRCKTWFMLFIFRCCWLFDLSVLELGNQWLGNTYRLCGLCGHKGTSKFYICSCIIYIYIYIERERERERE